MSGGRSSNLGVDCVRVGLLQSSRWLSDSVLDSHLEILVVGAPNLGEDPREDVEGRRDWWAGLKIWCQSRCRAPALGDEPELRLALNACTLHDVL